MTRVRSRADLTSFRFLRDVQTEESHFVSVPDGSEPSSPSELRVVVRPEVLQVQLGQTVELTCVVDGATASTTIYWIQDTPERVIDSRLVRQGNISLPSILASCNNRAS